MEWLVIVWLLFPVGIAILCLIDFKYRKKNKALPEEVYVYVPTKADRYAEEHFAWDRQFGPPYFYNTIEDRHMNSINELISDAEVLRRHKEFENG